MPDPARIAEVRRRLAADGPPRTRPEVGDFALISLPAPDCDVLRDLLVAERVETVVEVGLAYGASALAVGEALATVGAPRPRHVVIDPFQTAVWTGVGWEQLRSAGLDGIAELIEQPSSLALPRLLSQGVAADAAFVDGSHRFHEVFLDLYFLRKIVRPGGLVVLDDLWWPSVAPAVRYFELNLGWRAVPFDGGTADPATGRPRAGAFRLPAVLSEPDFQHFQPFA